jgi:hypothetical protein
MKLNVRSNMLTVLFVLLVGVLGAGIWYIYIALVTPGESPLQMFSFANEYWWWLVWATILFALVVLAAYLGAFLAIRKYASEKKWEAKHLAYSNVLHSMSVMQTWADETHENLSRLTHFSESKQVDFSQQYEATRQSLWRDARIGALTVSARSVSAFQDVLRDIKGESFRFGVQTIDDPNLVQQYSTHCDKIRTILNNHITELILLARDDLRIR